MPDVFLMFLGPILLIHFFYLWAVRIRNLSVIDTAWGLGFVLLSLIGLGLNPHPTWSERLVAMGVCIWGIRLAVFLHLRNHGRPEDFRYAAFRKNWGTRTNLIAYFKVYWLQFFLMIVVALPIFGAHYAENLKLSGLNYLGVLMWIVGFAWEAIADAQKSKFKKNPAHHHLICQTGLWSLSRHPNYFGETTLWWGLGFIALNGNNFWVLLGPLFLNFLLLKVSGVPLLEARYQERADFQEYAKHTPRLIPNLKLIFRPRRSL